jgi:hypothetical protein
LENGKDSVAKKDSKKTEAKPKPSIDVDRWFARFWDVFPRKEAEDAARRAFVKVIKAGADPERLVYAAQVYAVTERERIEREGTPQYTKTPANWLRDGKWKDPPPPGSTTTIDERGNVVAVEQPQRVNSWFAAAAALIAESEAGIAAGTHDAKGWPIYGRRQ